MGALLGPLGLLVMLRWRRRGKGGKMDLLLLLLVVGLAFGLSLAACNGEGGGTTQPPVTPPGGTITPTAPPAQPGGTSTPTQPPTRMTPTPITCPTPSNTPYPTPTDDIFHITSSDLQHLNMHDYLQTEPEALLLARLAIGEAAEGGADTETEKRLIIWTVRIRAEIGYSQYRAPFVTTPTAPVPTDIKLEIFAQNQFQSIQDLTTDWGTAWVIYDDYRRSNCASNIVRMANPCDDIVPGRVIDLQRLRDAYNLAQQILTQNIDQAPDEIKCFESFWAASNATSQCSTYEQATERLRPPITYGKSTFFDCAFVDNYWLFHDYAQENGWLP
jgi:hypothetical protein